MSVLDQARDECLELIDKAREDGYCLRQVKVWIEGIFKDLENSQDQWQPIETAPKDGTVIDILLNGKSRIPDVRWGVWDGYEKEVETWCDDIGSPVIWKGDPLNKITHWMLPPQPPKAKEVA